MMPKKSRGALTIPFQLMEMSMAAPQVIGLRLLQMALSGPQPSVKANQEYVRMWTEKVAAYNEACTAIAYELVLHQQRIWISSLHQLFALWTTGSFKAWNPQNNVLWENMFRRGLTPVHRRTMANAKRLQKSPLG